MKMARLYKRIVSGRVTLLPGTELRPVSFNKRQQTRKHFSRIIHVAHMFPQCFKCQFLFSRDANCAYATRQRILNKIRACEHLQKFCELEQASTHLIFAMNSSNGQILRALSNLMRPFDIPTRKSGSGHT